MNDLEIKVNDPFDPSLIKHLYSDEKDLKLASPLFKFPFNEEEWKKSVTEHPNNCSLVFAKENQIVGHVALIVKDENLFLCYVILNKNFRGTGLAKMMILQAEEFCRLNYPHHVISLNVDKQNVKALNLYLNLGYSKVLETSEKFQMTKILKI